VRRYVSLLLMGGLFLALMLGVEDPPPPPPPLLEVASPPVGEDFLVRGAESPPGATHLSILVRRGEKGRDLVQTGHPLAVAAGSDRVLHLVYADPVGSSRLEWPEDGEELPAWTRIRCSDQTFTPVAAVGIADGSVVVVGRLPGPEEDAETLAWARLDATSFEARESLHVDAKDVRHPVLVRRKEGAELVWAETIATGTVVKAFPVPTRGDLLPRALLETSDVRGIVPLHALDSVLVLRGPGAVTVVPLDGGPVRDGRVEGLPDSEGARFAALSSPPRLLGLDGGRLPTWPLDPTTGVPLTEPATDLDDVEDYRWILLVVAVSAALVIGALIAHSSRGVGILALGRRDGELDYADPLRRLIAAILDFALVWPLLRWGVGEVTGIGTHSLSVSLLTSTGGSPETIFATLLGLFLAYHVVGEAVFGQTLGKRALMLRTVTLDGGRAPFGAIVVRNLLRFVPDFFGGALLIFLTPRRQRVGDWLARTVVVRVRRLEIPSPTFPTPPEENPPAS